MNAATTSGQTLHRVKAAAEAAVSLLPASAALHVGGPTRDLNTLTLAGQAVCAHFNGAAEGEVVVVVGQDLVDALRDSPLGSLDVAQAVRPALEAAAATLGPVVVDPGRLAEPEEALVAVIAAGGAAVPLTDGADVCAVVALTVAAVTTHMGGAQPEQPRAANGEIIQGRAGLELLHDVEMEVTAELGRTQMSVRELLSLIPGTVIELDRAAGGPADLLVNGRLLARGEVVVIDENFGIRITEIVAPTGDRS
jgi:flagellar motor switch protein FliN/FliY